MTRESLARMEITCRRAQRARVIELDNRCCDELLNGGGLDYSGFCAMNGVRVAIWRRAMEMKRRVAGDRSPEVREMNA